MLLSRPFLGRGAEGVVDRPVEVPLVDADQIVEHARLTPAVALGQQSPPGVLPGLRGLVPGLLKRLRAVVRVQIVRGEHIAPVLLDDVVLGRVRIADGGVHRDLEGSLDVLVLLPEQPGRQAQFRRDGVGVLDQRPNPHSQRSQ